MTLRTPDYFGGSPSPKALRQRRPKAKSPTARAMEEARRLGFDVGVVERWVPQARRRVDLFGCIDLIACRPGFGVLGIQATAGGGSGMSNHNARVRKATAEPRLRAWLASGARFEVWSFVKVLGRWQCRRQELTLSDLPAVPPGPGDGGELFADAGPVEVR